MLVSIEMNSSLKLNSHLQSSANDFFTSSHSLGCQLSKKTFGTRKWLKRCAIRLRTFE